MRFFFAVSLFAFLVLPGASAFAADGTGIGLTLGVPSGVTGRTLLTTENSIDYGAGWSIVDTSKFHVYADYLWSRPHTFEVNEEKLDLFFGGGIAVRTKSGSNDNEVVFGPRIPVGISYFFANPDLELFALGAVNVGILPSSDVYFDLLVGARFYVF